jgi:hypothetical protein
MASCLLQQKLWPSERTTCDWQNVFTKPRWIPKCTNCNELSQQQVVHIPHSLQAATVLDFIIGKTHQAQKVHSKSAYPVAYRDATLIRQRTSQPTPLNHKGILNLFQPLCKLSVSPALLVHPLPHRSTQSY